MAGGEFFYVNQIRNWKPSGGGGWGWLAVLIVVAAVVGGVLLYLEWRAT